MIINISKALFDGETMRLMAFAILVKPLALVSQVLIARYFGAGAQLDAFNFSLFLITFLAWTVSRVFATVAIPQVSRLRQEMDEGQLAGYQNAIIGLYNTPVIILTLLFWVWGDLVVDFIGAKLPPETKEYSYSFLKLMAIPAVLFAFVRLNIPLLNLNKLHRLPAVFGPVHSATMLSSVVLLHGKLGVMALPIGWSVSFFIQSSVLWITMRKRKIIRLVRPRMPDGGIATLWSLSWMVLVSQTLLMANSFVDKWFAAGLPVGSISYINYSMIILNFGQQIFSMSLVVVMFTKMSEFLAEQDVVGCDNYIRHNLVRVSNIVVPVCIGLFVVSPEMIKILFERGAFTSKDSAQTAATVAVYLLGLPAIVINGIVARVFHSFQKLKQKILLSVQYIVTNVLGNFFLVKTYGTIGLAISSTTAINLHLLLSLLIMKNIAGELQTGQYVRIIIRPYLMAGFSFLMYQILNIGSWVESFPLGAGIGALVITAAVKFGVIIVFYGMVFFLGVKINHSKNERSRKK